MQQLRRAKIGTFRFIFLTLSNICAPSSGKFLVDFYTFVVSVTQWSVGLHRDVVFGGTYKITPNSQLISSLSFVMRKRKAHFM